jgi:hypothetical protein
MPSTEPSHPAPHLVDTLRDTALARTRPGRVPRTLWHRKNSPAYGAQGALSGIPLALAVLSGLPRDRTVLLAALYLLACVTSAWAWAQARRRDTVALAGPAFVLAHAYRATVTDPQALAGLGARSPRELANRWEDLLTWGERYTALTPDPARQAEAREVLEEMLRVASDAPLHLIRPQAHRHAGAGSGPGPTR